LWVPVRAVERAGPMVGLWAVAWVEQTVGETVSHSAGMLVGRSAG